MPTDAENQAIRELYSTRVRERGAVPAALGWNKPKHRLRYAILAGHWELAGRHRPARLLDFGCGFGDLYGWLRAQDLEVAYTGLDINRDLVDIARGRYPAARFVCTDCPGELLESGAFDLVMSSGVHNHRLADNAGFIRETFALFDRVAVEGFSLNFLSNRVNFERPENYYADPAGVLGIGLGYTRRVVLRHDYMPFEFTVHVDKRVAADTDLNVFEPYVAEC